MVAKAKPWEAIAVDLVYRDKDPVTVAVLPRDFPNLEDWLTFNIKRPTPGTHVFVYTYDITLQ